MEHDLNKDLGVPAEEDRVDSNDEGIIPPGERILRQEIEELMKDTPDVPVPGKHISPSQKKEEGSPVSSQTPPVAPPPAPPHTTTPTPPAPSPAPPAPQPAPSVPPQQKQTLAAFVSPPPTPTKPATPPEAPPLSSSPEDSKRRLKAIRTYFSDVAETVRGQQVSMTDIALAEQKKREEAARREEDVPEERSSALSVFLTTLGIVLILAGIGVVGYFYLIRPEVPTLPPAQITDTILPADEEVIFSVASNESRTGLLRTLDEIIENARAPVGSLTVIRVTRAAMPAGPSAQTESAKREEEVSSREFLNLFATHIDAPFLRSIEPAYMFGIYRAVGETQEPFLVLTTSFFENAFAGLLRWEPFIAEDLPFLVARMSVPEPLPVVETATTSTSTSERVGTTSVPEEVVVSTEPYVFKDMIIANHDARVLQNRAGDIRMLYSFPRRDLLIITTNPETFKALLNRMNMSRFEG